MAKRKANGHRPGRAAAPADGSAAAAASQGGAVRHDVPAAAAEAFQTATRRFQAGDPTGAIPYYRQALTAAPNAVPVAYALAVALVKAGDLTAAIAQFQDLLARDPNHVDAHRSLGYAELQRGQVAAGMAHYRRSIELAPDTRASHQVLRNMWTATEYYKDSRQAEPVQACYNELLAAYRHALAAAPDDVDLHLGVATVSARTHRQPEAIARLKHALSLAPEDVRIHVKLARLYREVGHLEAAASSFAKALELDPGQDAVRLDYLFLLHYVPGVTAAQLYRAYADFGRRVAQPTTRPLPPPQNADKAPLRVGLLAKGRAFGRHPGLWLRLAGLEALDPHQITLVIYCDGDSRNDELTERVADLAVAWRNIGELSHSDAAEQIRADGIDVLISLVLPIESRVDVFTRRPAPVQALWGGVGTSGLAAMDWLIADPVSVPAGEDACYTERVYRLPGDYIVFTPPAYAPAVTEAPVKRHGRVTFGCFNKPAKVNQATIALWARVLQRVPDSQLLLKGAVYEHPEKAEETLRLFDHQGIARDRILLEGKSQHSDLLARYNDVDIALDPWPYSGGLTTCEALWMGVPVVTLPAPAFTGRHAATHLVAAGLDDWVVASGDAYVAVCAQWAEDPDALAQLRAGLRDRVARSSLCDGPGFARALEDAVRYFWHDACRGGDRTAS